MVMDECPSISWTIFGCTSFVRRSVAHVCLRSWNLVLWGRPAFLSRGFQDRLVRLWGLTEVPTLVVNPHSPAPPTWCSLSARMASLVSLTVRLLRAVSGCVDHPVEDGSTHPQHSFL